MSVNKYLVPILLIAVLLGAVGIAQLAGAWTTSGRDVVLTDATGNPDPAGIKGWMTLEMVAETYGIPLEELYARLGLPADLDPQTELKSLEAIVPAFEMDQVRTVVADYLAGAPAPQPTPPAAATPMPQPAQETPAPTHVPGTGDGTGADRPTSTPLPAGQSLSAAEIKGRMTLREVADLCGVPLDYLYEKLSLPAEESPDSALKDLAGRYGLEVETVRAVVQEYQDAHP